MKFSEIELPSNRKFGFFFTFVFAFAAFYFFYKSNSFYFLVCSILCFMMFIFTIFKSDLLRPLNQLWMRFGYLLGMLFSPIILGIFFFGMFTPIAILMRISGRDELSLKLIRRKSYWILREPKLTSISFKYQF